MSLGLYFHTLRHLRPVQVYGRLTQRLSSPAPDHSIVLGDLLDLFAPATFAPSVVTATV